MGVLRVCASTKFLEPGHDDLKNLQELILGTLHNKMLNERIN